MQLTEPAVIQEEKLPFFQKIARAATALLYRFTIPTLLFIFSLGIVVILFYIRDQQHILIDKFQTQEEFLYRILEKSMAVDQHPMLLTKNIFNQMQDNLQNTFFLFACSLAIYLSIFILIVRKLKGNAQQRETFVLQLQRMNTELQDEISEKDGLASRLKTLNEEFKYQSLHDSLTQLPNRRAFEDRLNLNVKSSMRNKLIFAVMMLDLDGFKLINDTLGHAVGDELLKEVASRLAKTIRGMDTVARLGGDEFAFILTAIDKPESAAIVCERILKSLKNTIMVKNNMLNISASIGIAIYPQDGDMEQMLLKNADIAMYHAKSLSRGDFQFYRESMNVAGKRELRLRNKFHDALQNTLLSMHYQPMVDLDVHAIVCFEALLRWHDPELGDVSPIEMLRVSSQLGVQVQLSEWIVEAICKQIHDWKSEEFDVPAISMNVTSLALESKNFIEKFKQTLEKFDIPAKKIILEVDESTLMSNTDTILTMLTELNNMGIKIAVDDFGVGYSSLSYLQKFPIKILKIDKSFVKALSVAENDVAIIQAIIAIGKALQLEVIAEGVETKEQREALLKLGCAKMQGFLFSAALPPDACVGKSVS